MPGWMGVGIDAFQENVTVPEVAVDVVGEFGGEGQENKSRKDADAPQENQGSGGSTGCAKARCHVAEEGGRGQQQTGQRQFDPVQPAEGGEGRDLEQAEQEDECDRRDRRCTRTRRRPILIGDAMESHDVYYTLHYVILSLHRKCPMRKAGPERMIAARPGQPSGRDLLPRTAVLIPALDEEQALPAVLEALPVDRLHSVIVADNGSTDNTAAVARALGAIVVREPRRGYGSACLAGIRHLSDLPIPPAAIVFLDADHPESAARLPLVLDPLARGADLVLGVRVGPGGGTGNRHMHARWGNRIVLVTARLLFGRSFRDLAPFRAIRMGALERLVMDDRDWGWTLQMQLRAVRHRLVIVEVDAPHLPRAGGRSKISGRLGMSLRVGAKMFYTLARERLRAAGPRPR
ncbi:MAG: glycosyltransferase family 2 protein [Gemmatimonadetes bacterium]|nr:glycosyltransferase family 2 protein [Gemmatimonadota bacterium]